MSECYGFIGQGVILDRSIFSDCVFARVCTREGFISDEGKFSTEKPVCQASLVTFLRVLDPLYAIAYWGWGWKCRMGTIYYRDC